MKKKTSLGFFLLYICFICLILGVSAELFLRHLRPDLIAPSSERDKYCVYDPEIGWINKPLAFGRFKDQDFNVAVNINSQGLRDSNYSEGKPRGRYRVGVFGDSFAWGYGVEQSQIFTEVLENEIQPAEVLNFGCSGYGQDQELLLLKRVASRYQFNLILVNIHEASDFENNAAFFQYGRYKPFFREAEDLLLSLEGVPVSDQTLGMKLSRILTDRSVALRILGNQKIQGVTLMARWVALLDRKSELIHKSISNSSPAELTCRLCSEIQKTASSTGSQVLFTLTPDIQVPDKQGHNQLLDDSENERALRDCLRAKGLNFIDLRPVFRKVLDDNPQRLVTFMHDRHWNEHGHKIVASAIKEYLDSDKNRARDLRLREL